MRELGQSMIGIYHSHPRSAPYPSPTDVAMAFYPDAFYFIISLEPRMDIRAFRIEGEQVREAEISVVGRE
jgi:proteasome lid subunit RPN8/RPN11